ncbi:MAG: hypothetical protein J6A90_05910 [Clostridia bacterium]|nr:hypothetical protein [Clostridia bacterium]
MKKATYSVILLFIIATVILISSCANGTESDFEPSGDKIHASINSSETYSLYWSYNNLDYGVGYETIYQMLEGKAYIAKSDEREFNCLIAFDEQSPSACPFYAVSAFIKNGDKIESVGTLEKDDIISNFLFEDGKIGFHVSLSDSTLSGEMYIFDINVRFDEAHEGNIYIAIQIE